MGNDKDAELKGNWGIKDRERIFGGGHTHIVEILFQSHAYQHLNFVY
jgi:hypothetical protein